MDNFMKKVISDELDEMWEKLRKMFCEECDGSCDGCAVNKTLDGITEIWDSVNE